MPFALLIVGIVLVVSSVRGTQDDLYKLVKGDFAGPNNYLYWVVSILIIGAVGYVPTLKPISRMFLVLVIVALFLSHGGVFQQLNSQLFSASSSLGDISSTTLAGGVLNPTDAQLQAWGIEKPIAPARPIQ